MVKRKRRLQKCCRCCLQTPALLARWWGAARGRRVSLEETRQRQYIALQESSSKYAFHPSEEGRRNFWELAAFKRWGYR
jgi:hypothetical protein